MLLSGAAGGHLIRAIGAAGLVLDICGAGLLTLGLLMSKEMIGEMGAMRRGGNDAPRLYWEATKTDARLALFLLAAGFTGQIVSGALS